MPDSKPPRSAQPGFWLFIGLIALFAGGKAILFDTLDPDCFWHLRVAAQLHRDGIGPIVDDLSFASSKTPWTPYSWLAELGMKSIWDLGGYRAAIAVTAILQGMLVILLAACCIELQRRPESGPLSNVPMGEGWGEGDFERRQSFIPLTHPNPHPLPGYRERGPENSQPQYLSAVIATTVGTFLILPYLSFRPVLMAFVLLFAIAWIVLRDLRIFNSPGRKAGDRPAEGRDFSIDPWPSGPGYQRYSVWCIVPLTVLLTNIHLFSFFVPAMVLAMAMGAMIEGDARQATRYGFLATATAMACLATPMLPGLIKTIFFYSAHDKMVSGPVIAEMQSFARGPMGWIAGGGVAIMLLCIAIRFRMVHIGQLICVVVTTILLFKLGRFAPIFALAACPALAVTLPAMKDRILSKRPIVILLISVLALGLGRLGITFPARSVALSDWVNRHGPDTPGYPCAAADFLDRSVNHPTGHLINEFSWGGYLAWRLEGKYQVLLDGRTQVYPQDVWQATYLGSENDRRKYLAGIHADAALLPAGNSKFRNALIRLGWTPVFTDNRAEVLLPPPTGLAASASSN